MKFLLVFIGGGFGSILRYIFSLVIQKQNSIALPWATLLANVISCLLFALTYFMYQQKNNVPENIKLFLLIGFCGGLSTFSTFSFETVELIKRGDWLWSIANVILSITLCFGIFYFFHKSNIQN
jgi:CrcB protein